MGFWFTLLIYVALFVLAELLRPKPDIEDAKSAGLGDFQFPTATEGRSVPLLWGTVQIKGPNVVWYGDLEQVPITEKVKTGLFSSEKIIKGYQYFVGVQFALSRGPVDQLRRVWIGEDLIFSGTPVVHNGTFTWNCKELFGGEDLGNGGTSGTMRFFEGNETQVPSTYLDDFQKIGPNNRTPAYRGTCYLAPSVDPMYVGNSTSIKPWKFEVRRIPDGLGLGAQATVNGADANPMNVVYEIMTDTDWGLGFPASDIDVSNFSTAGSTLATEGNGFSFLLDRQIEAIDLLKMLEEQIDGVVFFDQTTAKWKVNLARFDYDIDTVPQFTQTSMVEIKNFARGSWEDTTNSVRVQYHDRDDSYKETFALAQDQANVKIQDGVNVSVTQQFPGVKDGALANQLAWRSLRVLTFPLAKATIIVDRAFFDLEPGQVVAVTDPDLDLTKLPMRITRIDYALVEDNRLTIDLVQDVFLFQVGKFGDPIDTNWQPPLDTLVPFPSDQQLAFEAPRALVTRDPNFAGITDKVWCTGRKQGVETAYEIVERHSSGTPTGTFDPAGQNFLFMLIGELNGALNAGSGFPLTSVLVTPTPDSQAAVETAFTDGADLADIGTNLINLIYVWSGTGDGEFMLVQSAQVSGGDVQLNNVWRGVLDQAQIDHADATKVYLLMSGGGLTDVTFPPTDNVHVKLLPKTVSDTVLESAATQVALTMANRVRRPLAPSSIRLDATLWAASTSLEGGGSGGEDFAIPTDIRRRDFRIADGPGDEIAHLDVDATTLFSDYPTANTSDHDLEVRDDPDGPNTLLFTETFNTQTFNVLRLKILQATDGVLPTRMRFVARHRHTVDTVVLLARNDLIWDFNVTTGLTGQFNFGALDTSDVSNLYTATVAGTYPFTLTSAFTAGDVEYRVNGGTWTQLVAAGTTTGSIAGVSASDTIEVRHLSSDAGALKQLDMNAPGAGQDGYAILFV